MIKYKYYIDSVEVFPLDKGNQILVYERRAESSADFDIVINTELVFNSKGSFDFKLQEQLDPSKEFTIIIKRKCGNSFEDFKELYFVIANGSFDDDRCEYRIKPNLRNDFDIDFPVNMLQTAGRVPHPSTSSYGVDAFAAGAMRTYTQAFFFDKVILFVAQKSNPKIVSIVSDFFQINPVNVSSDALPGVNNEWTKLVFCSLSDVQEPVPSNVARIENVTLRQILDDLNVLFRVYWFVDENFNLRIEHERFFKGTVGLDITTPGFSKPLAYNSKYKYDLDSFPKIERIKLIDSDQYAGVRYGFLSAINTNKNSKEVTTRTIRTDFAKIIYQGGSTDDGLFLFATLINGSGDYEMIQSVLDFSLGFTNGPDQNFALTPHVLFSLLHTYNRNDYSGLYESSTYIVDAVSGLPGDFVCAGGLKMKTVKPIILRENINFRLCCEDELDAKKLIKTVFGNGELEKATFEMKTDMINSSLKFQIPEFNFLPTDLPGLDLWLRGDRGITVGAGPGFIVTQWDDYSGNARHAVANPGNEPSQSVTGMGSPPIGVAFEYNSVGPVEQFLTVPLFQLFPNKRGTIFILFKVLTSNTNIIISTNNSNPGDVFFDVSWAVAGYIFNDNLNKLYSQTPSADGLITLNRKSNTEIYSIHNSMTPKEFIDPFFSNFIPNPQIFPNTQISANPLILGFNSLLTNLDGIIQIKEVIIYDHSLTDAEIEKVELYLAKTGYYQKTLHIES